MSDSNVIVVPRLYASIGSKQLQGYPIDFSCKGDGSDTVTIGYATPKGKTRMSEICEAYNTLRNQQRR